MNEQIQKLAEQAAKYSAIMALPTGESGDKLFVEKFAELIVRECIAEIESVKVDEYGTDVYDIGYDDGLTQSVETIKEHFGVEL